MHVSAFAFGALQVLVVAASALPANLTGRDDYYGDARRDHLPTVTTPLTSGFHMQATYYATGTGACGYTDNDSLPIVAISHLIYGNGGNCNQVCTVIRSLWKAWSQFRPYLYSGSRSRILLTASHSTGTSATNAWDALNMTSVSSSMVHVIRNSDHDSCCQISALHFFRALGRI